MNDDQCASDPQQMTMDSRPAVNDRMVLRIEEDEGAFLFDPDTGDVSILNPTALAVYRTIDGRRTVTEIVQALRDEYDDMGDEAPRQVLAAVQTLAGMRAVQ